MHYLVFTITKVREVMTQIIYFQSTWDNMKRLTLKRFHESKKTGSSGSRLKEIDKIVLDCIKADASSLTGLGQKDDMPNFSQVLFNWFCQWNILFYDIMLI